MTSVLIVDDDPVIRTITAMSLKRDDWAVTQAESGAVALDVYDPATDLVLLDLMMPDMDGREVLAAIKERNPAARAVFITARHDIDEELLGLGAVGVMRKPYDPLTLGTELRKFLA